MVDDYTPLRELARQSEAILASGGHIFEVADGDMYVPWSPGGANGSDFYTADNPPLGVTFTYWVGESLQTRVAARRAAERRAQRAGEDTPYRRGTRCARRTARRRRRCSSPCGTRGARW